MRVHRVCTGVHECETRLLLVHGVQAREQDGDLLLDLLRLLLVSQAQLVVLLHPRVPLGGQRQLLHFVHRAYIGANKG